MILSFLTSKLGGYVVGGAILALLIGGGMSYISHLRNRVASLQDQVASLEKAAKIYEQDKKTDDKVKSEQDRIDRLPSGDLQPEFDKLRQQSRGKGGQSE